MFAVCMCESSVSTNPHFLVPGANSSDQPFWLLARTRVEKLAWPRALVRALPAFDWQRSEVRSGAVIAWCAITARDFGSVYGDLVNTVEVIFGFGGYSVVSNPCVRLWVFCTP